MRIARSLALAFGLFAASFALHIVGGATDQGWLFALAVVLIYVSAAGFPAIAWWLGGARRDDRVLLALGAAIGLVLTVSALWAANDRSFAWWQAPGGVGLVAATSVVLELGRRVVARLRLSPRRLGPVEAGHARPSPRGQ